jgi:hypothetical protein
LEGSSGRSAEFPSARKCNSPARAGKPCTYGCRSGSDGGSGVVATPCAGDGSRASARKLGASTSTSPIPHTTSVPAVPTVSGVFLCSLYAINSPTGLIHRVPKSTSLSISYADLLPHHVNCGILTCSYIPMSSNVYLGCMSAGNEDRENCLPTGQEYTPFRHCKRRRVAGNFPHTGTSGHGSGRRGCLTRPTRGAG